MSRENVEVVRQVYEAVGRRDADAVLALYDTDVEWDASNHPRGDVMGRRHVRGHEGLRLFFRDWYQAWEDYRDDCEELIDAGDHVISVSTQRARGRASGVELAQRAAGVWTILEGRVVRVVWFPSREEALEAVGLRE